MVYQCALRAEKKNATYGNSVGNIRNGIIWPGAYSDMRAKRLGVM